MWIKIFLFVTLCLVVALRTVIYVKKAWVRALRRQGLLEPVEGEECPSQCPYLTEDLDLGIIDYCRYYDYYKTRQAKCKACALGIKRYAIRSPQKEEG